MSMTLQVLYPVSEDSTFDHAYYADTHMAIVGEHMAPHFESVIITKGLAGGPDTPPDFHAIATMAFKDQAALDAALAAAGPALADIPNFYNRTPRMLIGETIG
jgi:uncharacterized protein (TIGR02118 family)